MIEITYEIIPGQRMQSTYRDQAEAEIDMNLVVHDKHYLPLSAVRVIHLLDSETLVERPMSVSINPDGVFYLEDLHRNTRSQ